VKPLLDIKITGDFENLGMFALEDKDKTKIIQLLGGKMQEEIKKRAPVESGKLKNSIKKENIEKGFKIYTNIDYAPYVEYGTGIYQTDEEGQLVGHSGWNIYPINAKALRWTDKHGNVHFSKHVFIKGQEGQFFFKEGRLSGLKQLSKIASDYIKDKHL
jgi:hypothetical protein